MKKRLLLPAVIAVFFLVACGKTNTDSKKADKNEVKVMTTFYPMYEFTKEIVGNTGEVVLLTPAGVEPHEYEPSAKQIAEIKDAKVLVYNSSHMEEWVNDLKKDDKDVDFIEASKNIPLMEFSEEAKATEEEHEEEADREGEEHSDLDPHVWLSPELAKTEVSTILSALVEKYPAHKAEFEKNAGKFIASLGQLTEEYHSSLSKATQKNLVTQHAAFGYLTKEFGLTQVPIAGISPEEEPTPSKLAELKKYVKDHKISIIYSEETANKKVAETLSKEAGIKLEELNPLESLTEQQMKDGENYISIMKDNLEALKKTIK